jgi:hypothetical protein
MLTSGARVQRAVQPLLSCVPGNARCYARSGPEIVRIVEQEQRELAPILAETDDECLSDVGAQFNTSLDAYAEAGRAAAQGDTKAADSAISRSTAAEISYTRRLDDCGFAEGRAAELNAALREINIDLLRLGEEAFACEDEACIRTVARRMETRAGDAVDVIDDFREDVGQDLALCAQKALATMRGAFLTAQRAATAILAGDYAAANEMAERAGTLQANAAEDLAACLESLEG